MKILYIFAMIMLIGCGSKQKIVETKTLIVGDTLIRHESRVLKLPVKHVTVIENPCRGDSIKPIDQVITIAGSKFEVSTDSVGDLKFEIETEKQETITVQETKIRDRVETYEKTESKTVGGWSRKWFWWSFLVNILLIGWIFRKPVQSVLKRVILPI